MHIPVFFLLQLNLLHHLSGFILNGTILWMVWRSRDDRKIARTNTVCHRVVYVPAVMRRQIIPNQNSMKVSAGDIVRLNIPADVVAEFTKYIGRDSSGTYTADPTLRAPDAPSNMPSQVWISRLDCEDHGYFCPVVVMSILLDMQYLHSPPSPCDYIFPKIHQTRRNQSAYIGAPLIPQEEEDNSKNPRHETQRPAAVSGILRWTTFSA